MKAPERVIDISKKTVFEFFDKASEADQRWILATLEKSVIEKGEKNSFFAFRAEFAKRFFPEIVAEKKVQKKPTFLEELKNRQTA